MPNIIIFFLIFALFCITNDHIVDVKIDIIAAIKDSGCSTHPHKVIEQKQIKDTYNYDSLGGSDAKH